MDLIDHRAQAIRRDRAGIVSHLQQFHLDLKFSCGIWCFSPGGGRFHARYGHALDIPARLDLAAKLSHDGLRAIEAHYPSEIDENNLQLWQQFGKGSGVRVLTVIPLLFFDAEFEW